MTTWRNVLDALKQIEEDRPHYLEDPAVVEIVSTNGTFRDCVIRPPVTLTQICAGTRLILRTERA